MTTRQLRILLVILIPLTMLAAEIFGSSEDVENQTAVRIYLPRTKTITSAGLTMDDIAHISGRNGKLAAKVSALPMGRAPFPGEVLVLTRKTIQARLASEGFRPPKVLLTGAAEIRLSRNTNDYSSDDLANAATEYLQKRIASKGVFWRVSKKPTPLYLAKSNNCKLLMAIDEKSPAGHLRVIISAVAGKKTIASRMVHFKLTYQSQRVVAMRDISAGSAITPQNVKIESTIVERRPTGKWRSPFGGLTRKAIAKGAVISPNMLKAAKPVIRVKRNEAVLIAIRGKGWKITTRGVALQNGKIGDKIRVRNIDSKKIIIAKVDKSGEVIPLTR
ncbi:MAG: flagellar basal body P-ring formation chaperone FlgA [Phycisphaerae bacterium]|nr:flagellar basal body P-ring formation chaperone FlgA [Phycisphaerae bacterium]